eukprot:gene7509-655_t
MAAATVTDSGCTHLESTSEPILPPPTCANLKTLVLDLDHTLIDCIRHNDTSSVPPNFVYTDRLGCRGKVFCRPYLMDFLHEVSQHFELVLFTAAGSRHADAVLATLDPKNELFQHRLYSEHTVPSPEWNHVKDLSRLGRDLSQILLVDDCPMAANFQPENLISVTPYNNGDERDTTLKELAQFLLHEVLPLSKVKISQKS